MPPLERRYTNVCFTWNNPGDLEPAFDPQRMHYLVYQMEVGANGTEHWQGYCEFKARPRLRQVKALLGSDSIHVEARRGSAEEASGYCMKDDTRKEGTEYREFGEMKETAPGTRRDLERFKDDVLAQRKRKRDLIDDHLGIFARYPKLYDNLKSLTMPKRNTPLQVILHFGDTGLGKTRTVYDRHEGDDLYVTPLSNNTPWYDYYDEHKVVLLDDFAGSASHMSLVQLLRLLDRYPVLVPTKGSHTWWLPDIIYVTTNILPKDWYTWERRESQYRALERRFTKVVVFHPSESSEAPCEVEEDPSWWKENAPDCSLKYYD